MMRSTSPVALARTATKLLYQRAAPFLATPIVARLIVTTLIVASLAFARAAQGDTFRIEIDYMVDTSIANPHSHMPTQAEIDAVIQMFACQGHTLIVEISDQLTHFNALQLDPNDRDNFFGYGGVSNSFKAIKDANFDHAGDGGWHYCIFGHQYEWRRQETNGTWTYFTSGSSGLGETPGDDFVVTLGNFNPQTGTPYEKASTLAHEFGHNLGLSHCGDGDCSQVGANMPNLASIMSYNYQLEGLRSGLLCNQLIPETAGYLFKEMDYSGGRLCPLNETSLDETIGTMFKAVDWDCQNGISGTVSQDISSDGPTWCNNSGSLEVIADYNEWGHLNDTTKLSPAKANEIQPTQTPCISYEEVSELRKKASCPQPTLATESCISPRTYWVKHSGSQTGTGSCNRAVDSVALGIGLANPARSAVILEPGTWNETSGGSLVIDRDVVIFAPKSAVVR